MSWKTMKLASRISSIRRQAWKQCRSWSAHSDSMWPDWLASAREAGGILPPLAARTAVTGCWASQSICRPGRSRRSSPAMATSRRAWPSPMGEEMYSTRFARPRRRLTGRAVPGCLRARPGCLRAGSGCLRAGSGCLRAGSGRFRAMPGRLNELADEEVDLDRVAGMGRVAGAGQLDQPGPRPQGGGQLPAGAGPDDGVVGALNDQAGAAGRGEQRRDVIPRVADRAAPRVGQRLGCGLQTPADPVLDLLGRVRKSTRLNSSHMSISYAVFCLKKKKKNNTSITYKKKKKKKEQEYKKTRNN